MDLTTGRRHYVDEKVLERPDVSQEEQGIKISRMSKWLWG